MTEEEKGLELLFGKAKDYPYLSITAWTIPISFIWMFVPIKFEYKLIGWFVLLIIGSLGINMREKG